MKQKVAMHCRLLQMVFLMDSVLIPYHVTMQVLFAPMAYVSAILGSEILVVIALKVIPLEKSSLVSAPTMEYNNEMYSYYIY